MALLESNFEKRLSFVHCGTKMDLHRELSYRQPNGSPRRAILALFFFSVQLNEWKGISKSHVKSEHIRSFSLDCNHEVGM